MLSLNTQIVCSSERCISGTCQAKSGLLAMKQCQIKRVIFVWEDMNISVLCLVPLCHCWYLQLHNMLYHEKHGPISAKKQNVHI